MTSTLSPKAATGVLVPAAVRARLTARIRADRPEIDADLADRIVTGTAEFLTVSAADPRARMVPSALIDVGWHAWVLHTVDYAEYCDRIGRFVHHVPDTGSRTMAQGRDDVVRTAEAIKAAGFEVDAELWAVAAADCSQCHAGCHDSP
ncbi:glycine-rich domain-containing protein [Embleya sp. MST-111070]|uniref:glycine-rich domain-containing protein n=1 Tax=Embleya sp. MST-111070 TaxID=3398231 RepID=UPI003F734C8C